MRLIEKKCPNCGADLEFKDNDKSCKCSHCASSFEIERDESKTDFDDQFDLKPLDKAFSALSFVIFLVIFVAVGSLIVVIFHIVSINSKKAPSQNNAVSVLSSDYKTDNGVIENIKQLPKLNI